MKKILLTLGLVASFSLAATAQVDAKATNKEAKSTEVKKEASAAAGPAISTDKETHNYGKIQKGANGDCFFTITNTGTEPLVITNAKGSCGCTVPTWPREAIAPGKSASMKVTYATNRVGKINKSVTITSNAKNAPVKVVKIAGEVLKAAPEDGAPVKKETTAPLMKN